MKRSEMLGKLWTLLYKETDYYEEDLKDLCEQILTEIEDAGMCPPLNENNYNYQDNDDRKTANEIRWYYSWEEE